MINSTSSRVSDSKKRKEGSYQIPPMRCIVRNDASQQEAAA